MLRLFRGRWLWGAIAAVATTWWIQRSRQQSVRHGIRLNGTGKALQSVARAGQSVVDQAVKALRRH